MNKEELKQIIIWELQQYSFGRLLANSKIDVNGKPRISSKWIEIITKKVLARIPDNNFEVIARGKVDKNGDVNLGSKLMPYKIYFICDDVIGKFKGKNIEIGIRVKE